MNNEPVAWINEEMQVMFLKDLADSYPTLWKPLYTHPIKELTDEEIWDWFKENTALTKESALMIARAILRKAQEK